MRKDWITMSLAVGLLAVLAGSTAIADSKERSFRARLNGFQEVPALSTPGNGEFRAKVNSAGSTITFELEYEDLLGPVAAAHVHFGQPGVNGGVSFFLCGGGGKPACPAAPAKITGTVVAADVIGPAAQGIAAGELDEILRAMRAGIAYANVHTTVFPGGEIRGQMRHHDDDDD